MSYVISMEQTWNGFSCGVNHLGSADTDAVIVIRVTFSPSAVNARQDADS